MRTATHVVRLEISPPPAHVRTARLVAVATARRSGVGEELLDEIRLAVGEACSRAVALHRAYRRDQLVRMEFVAGPRFAVIVRDSAPPELALRAGVGTPDPLTLLNTADESERQAALVDRASANPDGFSEEDLAVGVGLALLAGLVDDVTVKAAEDGSGTVVRMSWPSAG